MTAFQIERKQYLIEALVQECRFTGAVAEEITNWVSKRCNYIVEICLEWTNQPDKFVFNLRAANNRTYRGSAADGERHVTILKGDLERIWAPTMFSAQREQVVILKEQEHVYVYGYSPAEDKAIVDKVIVFR